MNDFHFIVGVIEPTAVLTVVVESTRLSHRFFQPWGKKGTELLHRLRASKPLSSFSLLR